VTKSVSAASASSALAVASPRIQLAWLSLAMFLGMTMWFSATAANAPIVAELHLTPAETAWLTMAVQGGFVIGTLMSAILNLPDIINPRRLFAIGCVLGAAANAALVRADGAVSMIALRGATGAALAWVYPPGMKIAAGSAMIGAIVGEWFGAPTGLGIVVLNSMENFQIPLLWATVIVIAAITLASYGLLTLAERAARRRIG